MWGLNVPADPLGVLQSHLSRLRRALRPEAEIVARPPGYVLQLPDEMIDAGRFEQLCKRASSSSNPKVTVELLEVALSYWRGSAFGEFAEYDWARPEAMRLDELRVHAQEELFEARLALGGHSALVGELEALVTRHPMRERFWHQLVVALYRSGRSAEALRRAETLRVVLREELGLDPSPAFRELEARVLIDDPTLLQSPMASRRSATRQLPVEPTRLVGRAEGLRRYPLLVVDEVGYLPFEQEAANLFFQLVSSRYEHASIILTSNLAFSGWGSVFGDQVVAAAMIDRIVHHADVLTLKGASYRLRGRGEDTLPSVALAKESVS
jgi:DNA-binding SARP family transcriptional activator